MVFKIPFCIPLEVVQTKFETKERKQTTNGAAYQTLSNHNQPLKVSTAAASISGLSVFSLFWSAISWASAQVLVLARCQQSNSSVQYM